MQKDLVRIVEGQRPTEEEEWSLFRHLAAKLTPPPEEASPVKWIMDTFDRAKELLTGDNEIKGLRTGYLGIDKTLRGIKPSDVIVLFGRTSEGKSLVAQNISLNIAKRGDAVMFVGLEMSDVENSVRFLQMNGEEELPIMYPDLPSISYRDIDGIVKSAKEQDAKLVVIDHIHALPKPPANSAADAIEATMYLIQGCARKYEIPIMVISHVNRETSGAPELSDLKGSSALEQCATSAIAVFRDEDMKPGVQQVAVRKNRNGPKDRFFDLYVQENLRLIEQVEWQQEARKVPNGLF